MRSALGWVVGVWFRSDVAGPGTRTRWRWAFFLPALLLVAGEAGATQLTASWTGSPSIADGYSVERAVGPTGTYAEVGRVNGAVTTLTDSTVKAGTTYCYRVRAFNGHGYSGYSNVACASPAPSYSLAVVREETGSGSVTSSPAGISCGTTCSASYPAGTAVTLTATAASGAVFTGWTGGGCGGTSACTVTLAEPTTIIARFALLASVPVTVTRTSGGSVTSSPAGISCGKSCVASYPMGTVVTLTAKPQNRHYRFTGWSGDGCSGTGPCTVTLRSAPMVSATFVRQ